VAEPRPHAHVVHAIPGRLRLRVPSARGRPERLESLRRRLAAHQGVRDVRVDARTGSVLVLGQIAWDALHHIGEEDGLFALVPPAAVRQVEDELLQSLERVESGIRGLSGGRFGLLGGTVAALVALALVQLLRGQTGTPATSLLWYAFSAVLTARIIHDLTGERHGRIPN